MNTVDAFRQAVEKDGLALPEHIVPGRIVRFPGIGKSNGNTSGWAWLSEDGQAGVFGDWSSGLSDTWHAPCGKVMTAAERAAHAQRVAELRRIRDKEETTRHADAAREAHAIWESATAADREQPYLKRKGVRAHGLRCDSTNRLIVPVTIDGEITSLQFIDATGAKLFLSGGAVKGGFFSIGDLHEANTLLLCEGYATGASLFEATGLPVVVAFNAGNLTPVAKQLRKQFPPVTIVLCGDHDLNGTGQRAARNAAEAIGGVVVLPVEMGMDFNDLMQAQGHDAVRSAIGAAIRREEKTTMNTTTQDKAEEEIWGAHPKGTSDLSTALVNYTDLLSLEIPKRPRYLPWLPEGGNVMAYGPRGVGKTFFGLGLAVALTTGGGLIEMESSVPCWCPVCRWRNATRRTPTPDDRSDGYSPGRPVGISHRPVSLSAVRRQGSHSDLRRHAPRGCHDPRRSPRAPRAHPRQYLLPVQRPERR